MEPIPSSFPLHLLVRQRTVLLAQPQRDRLAEIASEITRHKTDITRLEQEGRVLEDSLSRVIYPVLTLPNEITARIFVHCLPSQAERPSPQTAPLLPAQICRHWRAVALATCELWSQICIEWPFDADGMASSTLVRTWISRAKGHPFSLGLRDSYTKEIPPELLTFISFYSRQIRCLEIYLPPARFRRLCPPHTPLPLLQQFATDLSMDEDLRELLESAPFLYELRLRGLVKEITFRLPSLTKLEMRHDISLEMFLHVLRHLPHLAELECGVDKAMPWTPDSHVQETFTSLSCLTLRQSDLSLLNFVRFPNLCRLGIHDEYCEEPYPLEVVLSFVSRSSCVISHLVLGFDRWDEEEFADWLEAFPSVTALEVHTGLEFDRLIPCLSTASVLPELRELEILSFQLNVDYTVLIEMLHQRRHHDISGVELQSFRLELVDGQDGDGPPYSWPPPNLAASELKRMMADGLRLVLILSFCLGQHDSWPDPSIARDSHSRFDIYM
ncbi:hypothetical protein K438DRAFT_1976442 [Mycena galopus ATCC 62051]|nr:hypothetical protein K438DRAFT_1976442 [Mycena galopus ATCC 62051]